MGLQSHALMQKPLLSHESWGQRRTAKIDV